MFTPTQRAQLNQLSRLAFGTESRWRKLYEAGAFDTTVDIQEVPATHVALNNSRKTPAGTIVTADKAKALGFKGEAGVVHRFTKERPDYLALVDKLQKELHLRVLYAAKLPNLRIGKKVDAEETSRLLSAFLFDRDKQLITPTVLTGPVSDEQYMDGVKKLVEALPEDMRAVTQVLVDNMNDMSVKNGLSFDAQLWLTDLVFCGVHPDQALNLYKNFVGMDAVA